MDIFLKERLDVQEMKSMSLVKKSPEVIFLLDINTADGRFLEDVTLQTYCSRIVKTEFRFPREEPP